jgi:hypothetical protein
LVLDIRSYDLVYVIFPTTISVPWACKAFNILDMLMNTGFFFMFLFWVIGVSQKMESWKARWMLMNFRCHFAEAQKIVGWARNISLNASVVQQKGKTLSISKER